MGRRMLTEAERLEDAQLLADYLRDIEEWEKEKNYDDRNEDIYQALSVAARLRYPCGVRIDPTQPEWPVVYIELPDGQISWHLPQHTREWDKHNTEEKYRRCHDYYHRFA